MEPTSTRPHVFMLRLQTKGGTSLGQDLQERQSDLVIDGEKGTAFLERHRSESDGEGEPIGQFKMALGTPTLRHIEDIVQAVRVGSLGPPTRGGPGASTLELMVRSGEHTDTKLLSTFDIPQMQQLRPLKAALNGVVLELYQHPVAAVRVSVQHQQQRGEHRFVLELQNLGHERVLLHDPRLLPGSNDRWAGVRVSLYPPEVPGVTAPPLKWQPLFLSPPPKDAPASRDVEIAPGGSISFSTQAWQPGEKGIRYLVQGVWSDYEGDPGGSAYRLRGAAFSEGIEVTPG